MNKIGLNLIMIIGFTPIAVSFYLTFLEIAKTAWKSNSKWKKWLACTYLFAITASVLRVIYLLVS